jgi:hypothetical protein
MMMMMWEEFQMSNFLKTVQCEASKNYKVLIITEFGDPFLSIISTGTDSDYVHKETEFQVFAQSPRLQLLAYARIFNA